MMLRDVGIVMLCIGVLLLVISLILIFALKIPDLLDELSGRKAKRQIKRLKELNVGTGSLGEVATEDVYQSISSSTLLPEKIVVKRDSNPDSQDKLVELENAEEASGNNLGSESDVSGSTPSEAAPHGEVSTSDPESEENVSLDEYEDSTTNYIEEDEVATTYVEDEDVTEMLNEIQNYVKNKKIIEIVEEQSSL